ncbi:MAG TPA: cupin domain-containing protein [Vicinamibacterales bacterium]|nr:cupin domain-containing protein [Vicinamibacterales bacterium]
MRVIDQGSAKHYQWGTASEGWHLLEGADLSVIQERVPPGDREHRHRHVRARQFFYVLAGEATLEIDGAEVALAAGQGVEVPPGTPHQFFNRSAADVEMLVISSPRSHGDRVDL